jgi:hypothetical protein
LKLKGRVGLKGGKRETFCPQGVTSQKTNTDVSNKHQPVMNSNEGDRAFSYFFPEVFLVFFRKRGNELLDTCSLSME